jgi:hypothetical protein
MANYPSSASSDSNLYVAVNSLATSLAGSLTSSGGNNGADIEVVSTTNFPSVGFITIDQEAIKYTSLLSGPPRFSGITRGADGTTAASHAASSTVKHNVIAAHHNTLKDEVIAVETDLLTGNPPVRKIGDTMSGILQVSGTTRASSANVNYAEVANSGTTAVFQSYNPNTNTYNTVDVNGSTINLKTGSGTTMLSATSAGTGILGTNTNDSASAGQIGEYVVSTVTNVSAPTTGTWGDATSISLTAGDWDVSSIGNWNNQGGAWTSTNIGISTTSGNSNTGLTLGLNRSQTSWASSTTTPTDTLNTVIPYRVSLSATTTVYFKFLCNYSSGTPRLDGASLRARRVR